MDEILETVSKQNRKRTLVGVGQQGTPGIDGLDVSFSNNLTILPGDNGVDGEDVIGAPGLNGQNQDQPHNNFNGKNGPNSQNSPNGAVGVQGPSAGVRDYAIIDISDNAILVRSARNITVSSSAFTVSTSCRYRITVNYKTTSTTTISINGVNRKFNVSLPGTYQATAIFNLDLVGGAPVLVVVPNGRICVLALD